MTYLQTSYHVSERRTCRTIRCARATYRYRSDRDPRTTLRQRILEMAQTRVRFNPGDRRKQEFFRSLLELAYLLNHNRHAETLINGDRQDKVVFYGVLSCYAQSLQALRRARTLLDVGFTVR